MAQAPIVYVQPHPWPSVAGDQPRATGSEAQSKPVVQRKADAAASISSTPGAPLVTMAQLTSHGDHRAARPAVQPHSSGLPVITAARVADSPFGASGLPLVYASPVFAGDSGALPAAPQTGSSAWPVVRVRPGDKGNTAAALTTWTLLWQPPEHTSASVVPVVREQIVPERAANVNFPVAHPREPLPLVAVATATARPAASRSVAGEPGPSVATASRMSERQAPLAARGAVRMQPAIAAEPAGGPAETKRPAPATIDIDRVVDKVHRKFIRQLVVEGERRGVR